MRDRSISRGRAHHGRGLGRCRTAALLVLLLTGSAACSAATDTAQDLGRVPIPTAPATPIVPTASVGHAQLVAMGDAVHLDLGPVQGRITASGPDLDLPAASPGSAPPTASKGVITVVLRVDSGSGELNANAFKATDDLGHTVPFTADQPAATATPGHDAVLHLTATFAIGHATLSWIAGDKPVATWDFEVELD